jgi:hypothetical protein
MQIPTDITENLSKICHITGKNDIINEPTGQQWRAAVQHKRPLEAQ